MENERVIIATDRQTLREVLSEIMSQSREEKKLPEFESDRISKVQASKLIGISVPTLDKRIKEGVFKEYTLGRYKYFLKSELIEALRNKK